MKPAATCASNLVSGILCEGSYCDNVSLLCQGTGLTLGLSGRFWVDYVSEEDGAVVCSGNAYMTGISCRGSYCDDISIECTYTNAGANNCQWSERFSEEQGRPERPSAFHFIRGIQCLDSYCDDLTVLWCEI